MHARFPIRRCLLAAAIVCLAGARASAAETPATAPPNVLLVSIDSLRRDYLGCYGARLPHAAGRSPTPRLDRLAAEGVRLDDAYAPSSWTLPSHVSLMTGLSPVVHGVETDLHTMDPTQPTLAGVLHANGYQTAGVFSGPYLEPSWGFGAGFDRYTAAYGTDVAAASRELGRFADEIARATAAGDAATAESLLWQRRARYERVRKLSHADVSSERVTSAGLSELDRLVAAQKPWFLFLHYFDVHYDYVPPPPFLTRFDPDYRGAMTGRDFLGNPAIGVPAPGLADGWIRRASPRDTEHLMALCAGEVAWVDQHVERVLARLAKLGQEDRTLVVVVSDHGDEFFEHGGIGHRRNLFEELMRIPLLLRLPGKLPAGSVVHGRVSLTDVYPTVLDLLDLPSPMPVTGRTMVPLVRGIDDGDLRIHLSRLVRLFEGSVRIGEDRTLPVRLANVQEAFWWRDVKIVRVRRWPLFPPRLAAAERTMLRAAADEQFQREDLYWVDLARDPTEPPEAFRRGFDDPRAAAALEAFRTRYRALRARRRALQARANDLGRSRTTDPGQGPQIDPEVRSKLEGLGYAIPADEAPRSPRQGFVLPPPGDTRTRAPR
jgi:arylsulfatase A-like enzyme